VLSLSFKVRQENQFPPWRQHRDNELLILQGILNSPISVD